MQPEKTADVRSSRIHDMMNDLFIPLAPFALTGPGTVGPGGGPIAAVSFHSAFSINFCGILRKE